MYCIVVECMYILFIHTCRCTCEDVCILAYVYEGRKHAELNTKTKACVCTRLDARVRARVCDVIYGGSVHGT